MAPRARPKPSSNPAQLTFDDYVAIDRDRDDGASLGISLKLRSVLARAIKRCPLSRTQIAARMTELVFGEADDGDVTRSMLDAWTAPSRDAWRFPLEYLPAFVRATGATEVLDLVAEACGCRVLVGRQALAAELGVLAMAKRHLAARERALRKAVPEEELGALLDSFEDGDRHARAQQNVDAPPSRGMTNRGAP